MEWLHVRMRAPSRDEACVARESVVKLPGIVVFSERLLAIGGQASRRASARGRHIADSCTCHSSAILRSGGLLFIKADPATLSRGRKMADKNKHGHVTISLIN